MAHLLYGFPRCCDTRPSCRVLWIPTGRGREWPEVTALPIRCKGNPAGERTPPGVATRAPGTLSERRSGPGSSPDELRRPLPLFRCRSVLGRLFCVETALQARRGEQPSSRVAS